MDLAEMISKSAVETFKEECLSNTCDICIKLHRRYDYIVSITPMAKHILIKYKTLEYKISREDALSYNEIVEFLVNIVFKSEKFEDVFKFHMKCLRNLN